MHFRALLKNYTACTLRIYNVASASMQRCCIDVEANVYKSHVSAGYGFSITNTQLINRRKNILFLIFLYSFIAMFVGDEKLSNNKTLFNNTTLCIEDRTTMLTLALPL